MNKKVSIAEFYNECYLYQCVELDDKTIRCRNRLMQKYVFPQFGHVNVCDMDTHFVNQLYQSLACSGLSDSSIYHVFIVIRGILKLAVSLGLISQSQYPLYAKRFPHAPDRIRIPPLEITPSCFTRDEMIRIDRAFGETPLDWMYRLAFHTGMKRDELLGLKVSDYHIEDKKLSIQTVMKLHEKGSPSCEFVPLPQGSRRRRTIPLGPSAQKTVEIALQDALRRDSDCSDPYLFRREDGRCFYILELSQYNFAFISKSGVDNFCFQTLRKNFIVCCFREGWSTAEVQSYVGITSPQNLYPYQRLAEATVSAFH